MLQKLNLSEPKNTRVFVVGDIHGEFQLLEQELNKLDFNFKQDVLLSVGDLVDRGPESYRALEFLAQPWFYAVCDNHEQMVIDAAGTDWHYMNGGEWFRDLNEPDKRLFIECFKQLPLLIEALLPDGRRIGVAHASLPGKQMQNSFETDWNNLDYIFSAADYRGDIRDVQWDRYQIGRAKKYRVMPYVNEGRMREFNVANIDHVYFGHTPLKESFTFGNCTWLDTGAFATGNLTIVEA